MRFSEAWLREFVNPSITTAEMVDQLTMAGLEVDAMEPAAAEFSGVVVGEVVDLQPHPNADKLRVCQVNVGGEALLQIVCGASNVSVGLKAPAALIGAVLPGEFKIKKSKLRGEVSLGMLCSEKELGLAADADGLMELPPDAPVGKDIREYLSLNDRIIELGLTPNRADCLSIEGVAREVALLNQLPFDTANIADNDINCQQQVSVTIEATDYCPRYLGRLIKGVDPSAQTPLWMQEKLRRSGLRSLGALVDVTNYVLLELGQPLHAFDADKIQGDIVVRKAVAGEELTLLNGQTVIMNDEALVIADQRQALALAGVMGGSESAVSDTTQDIFLECAFFNPAKMMGKARAYGLHTDSSHRFERGVDPFLQKRAIERAAQLITDIAGGSVGPITEVVDPTQLPARRPVKVRAERINKLLGISLPEKQISDILQRLGMEVQPEPDGWQVVPPGFRFDIAIEADLIEEVARVYGYNNLPQSSIMLRSELSQAKESIIDTERFKDMLVDRGYQEAITYSFVDRQLQEAIDPDKQYVTLKNPISADMSVMRTTLWCGLISAALKNINRQQNRVRLFETGLSFVQTKEQLLQQKMLAGLILGNVFPEHWGNNNRTVDFFDLKADVESLCAITGYPVSFSAAKHPALHPGQTAEILTANDEHLGWLGMLHPTLEKKLGFDSQVFLFELNIQQLSKRRIPEFKQLSKFPSVRRDLAVIVDESVTSSAIVNCINTVEIQFIQEVIIFDVYRGVGVADGQKSVALGLILQDYSQTLTDTEIDAIVNNVLAKLSEMLNAKLRV